MVREDLSWTLKDLLKEYVHACVYMCVLQEFFRLDKSKRVRVQNVETILKLEDRRHY